MAKRFKNHVFIKVPVFCHGMRPALLWVKCPCGRVHKEYFGPKDMDVKQARVDFLEKQLALAYVAMAPESRKAKKAGGPKGMRKSKKRGKESR